MIIMVVTGLSWSSWSSRQTRQERQNNQDTGHRQERQVKKNKGDRHIWHINCFLNNVENCNIVPGCFPCSQQRTLLLWKVFPQPLFSFEVFHISLSLRIICSEIYITRIENNVPTTLPESNFSYTTRPKSWSKLVREIERRHWTWTSWHFNVWDEEPEEKGGKYLEKNGKGIFFHLYHILHNLHILHFLLIWHILHILHILHMILNTFQGSYQTET